jgi:NAD(P)-dependent dehydrogenase (short-subunit alcohol dehydrogenase family)
MSVVNSNHARKFASTGPLTPDHVLRTKPHARLLDDPPWSDAPALRRRLIDSIEQYQSSYRAYVAEHGGSAGSVDASPRVILVPGAGLFASGATRRAASITADIAEQTLATKLLAESIGEFRSLLPRDLFDIEFWPLELAKLKGGSVKPLDRQIVVISGGAGAIGAAVAESCVRAGAHVAITDVDQPRLATTVERLRSRVEPTTVIGVPMDVTSEVSVHAGFDEIVRAFGGVDVIVPNAGIAHVAPIDELKAGDFRRVMEVNAVGYLLFMREGIRILKEQGIGGNIILNASKNVFAPGRDFAAYSASKAAAHQLGKIAAIELAPFQIRVNMINADGVFGDEESPSGLWKTVGPDRSKSRGIAEEQLAEHYRNRNLLKAKVLGRHIGNAVVYFASNASPTTGATLPVDGGLPEAFPR